MTGIERLHELVAGISPDIAVCGVTKTSYDREHMEVYGVRLRDFLADIADQIDRELREERSRWDDELCDAQMDKTCVMAVYLEMNRHVLGHEGMEDSPVARWARELREALGGDGRDHAEDVSMSAYDLLPQEDRDAIAWVREHGGLDAVKKLLDWVVGHCSTRQQLDFDFWLSGRVMHELGFDEDMADRDEVGRRLRDRLMPEGMEWPVEAWPRFEDGEPLRVGDEVCSGGRAFIVDHVVLFSNGESTVCAEADMDSGKVRDYARARPSYRLKRHVPKVLDADGVEVHKGDTVWSLGGGGPYTVAGFDGGTPYVLCDDGAGSAPALEPSALTHRVPALAADGKPLREGETVWDIESDIEYEVVGIHTDEDTPVRVMRTDGSHLAKAAKPSTLTHERPDSWERLEEDADKNPFDYCKDVGHRLDTCENSEAYKARDLVRRARALAERERGE